MPNTGDIIIIDKRSFILGEVIGAGGFGVVFAGREVDPAGRPSGPDLAIKLVDRIKMAEHQKSHIDGTRSARKHFIDGLENEIAALHTLQALHGDLHKINVVRLIHAGAMQFDDEPGRRFPALVMERCRMSLAHILGNGAGPCQDAHRRLKTQEGILAFLADMGTAVAGIAASGRDGRQMAHRDIKPSNVLEINGAYLLTDFGNAKEFDEQTFSVGGLTENYVAPELWDAIRRKDNNEPEPVQVSLRNVDIYALGMALVKVLTGGIPWRQTDRQLSGASDLLDDYRFKLREAIAALPVLADIDEDGTVVPWQRPSNEAVAVFRTELEALALDMVRIDPDARPSAAALLRRVEHIRDLRRAPSKQRAPSAPQLIPALDVRPAARNAVVSPPPIKLARRGLRGGGSIAAGLVLLAAVSASAAAVVLPDRELAVASVAPLAVPGPARWSGRSQDYVRPLCLNRAGPSLAAGERIVTDVVVSPRWLGETPVMTAAIHADSGVVTPASCGAMDVAKLKWQCVGGTDGLMGSARMVITTSEAKTPVIISFHVLSSGSRCPMDGPERPDQKAGSATPLPMVAKMVSSP